MSESDNQTDPFTPKFWDHFFKYCSKNDLLIPGTDRISEEGLRQLEMIVRDDLDHNTPRANIDYKFFFDACWNEMVSEGIVQCLVEYFPDAAAAKTHELLVPLHIVCLNKNVTPGIVQLLIDAHPDSVRSLDMDSEMPLHYLCRNDKIDEIAELEILKLLLEKCPEAIRHANEEDYDLPIHFACESNKSPEFCRLLIEAYPGSERICNADGKMPLHCAGSNTVATVEYLYKLYPDAINHETRHGEYPIHYAIFDCKVRSSIVNVEIVQFLLDCDPNVKLQRMGGVESLLYYACQQKYKDSDIEIALKVINALYDAYPEAIEDDEIVSDIDEFHPQIQDFVEEQLDFARQAKYHYLMTTPDGNGQLPLHVVLEYSVITLGVVKLMVKGNPAALQSPDNSGAFPLHVACEHHNSPSVIQYLISLDTTTLDAVDREGNTALHYACRSANFDTITLLLERYDAVSVSKRNAHKKLPIDLLWESNEDFDRENVEYMESVFRLLKAYPETVMTAIMLG